MSNLVELRPGQPLVDRPTKARHRRGGSRAGLGLGPRPRTENARRITKRSLEDGRVHLRVVDELDVERPRTRGDCETVERPCPFVGCRHNLYLDVDEGNGSIKYNFPDKEPDEVEPERSCALDIADRGGGTLEDIGELANVTRERIRQIEAKALERLRKRSKNKSTDAGVLRDYCDAPNEAAARNGAGGGIRSLFAPSHVEVDDEDDDERSGRGQPSVSFFLEGDGADDHVTRSVWTMFVRWQNARGFPVSDSKQQRVARAAKTPWRKQIATDATRKTMATKDDEQKVLGVYTDLKAKLGREPTNAQLLEAPALKGWSMHAVRSARAALIEAGLAAAAPSGRQPGVPSEPRKPKAAPKKKSKMDKPLAPSKTTLERLPSSGGRVDLTTTQKAPRSNNPIIAAMEQRRDELADKVAALTVAIDVMREGARA